MFSRPFYSLVTVLSVLLLSGCADTLPDGGRLQRFTDVIRGYDSTLSQDEKEAAISELQAEKERQQAQIDEADGAQKAN